MTNPLDVPTEIDRMVGDIIAKLCSHAVVNEAMQDSWNDICSDTSCHPLDIEQGNGKKGHLTFSPNHWANQIAKRLFVTALKLRLEVEPRPGGVAQGPLLKTWEIERVLYEYFRTGEPGETEAIKSAAAELSVMDIKAPAQGARIPPDILGLIGRISDYFHVNAKPSDDLAIGYMRELDAIILAKGTSVSSTNCHAPSDGGSK